MKKPCDHCGGSGQIHFLAGVSRFHLSCEECPACVGFGYELPADDTPTRDTQEPPPAKKPSSRKKAR